jgi:prepilin-type N-terminal cleavage/methylation domain-containing protein
MESDKKGTMASPELQPMTRNRRQGFTLVEIMIVVIIFGILMTIALPGFITARAQSRAAAVCRELREILTAKDQFIMNNQLAPGQGVVSTDLVPTYMDKWPTGPVTGSYVANPVGTDPTFAGQNEAWYSQHCLGSADNLCTL